MDPYKLRRLTRALTSQIREHIAGNVGATAVDGLGEVIDDGDAIAGGERTVDSRETSAQLPARVNLNTNWHGRTPLSARTRPLITMCGSSR